MIAVLKMCRTLIFQEILYHIPFCISFYIMTIPSIYVPISKYFGKLFALRTLHLELNQLNGTSPKRLGLLLDLEEFKLCKKFLGTWEGKCPKRVLLVFQNQKSKCSVRLQRKTSVLHQPIRDYHVISFIIFFSLILFTPSLFLNISLSFTLSKSLTLS